MRYLFTKFPKTSTLAGYSIMILFKIFAFFASAIIKQRFHILFFSLLTTCVFGENWLRRVYGTCYDCYAMWCSTRARSTLHRGNNVTKKYAYFLNHVNRAKNSEWSGSPKCLFHKILTPNKIMYFLSGFINIMQLSSKRLSRFSWLKYHTIFTF